MTHHCGQFSCVGFTITRKLSVCASLSSEKLPGCKKNDREAVTLSKFQTQKSVFLGSFNKFMSAFRTGDLDLAFALRDADGYAALLAAIKLVRVPLIPALLPLLRQFFDFLQFFQEPQAFIGALQMITGKTAVQGKP